MVNVGINLAMLIFLLLPCKTIAADLTPVIQCVENGQYSEAWNALQKIDTITISSELEFSQYKYIKGGLLYLQNKYQDAIPELKRGLQFSKTTIEQRMCDYIENMHAIGNCYFHLEDYENAERWYRKAIIATNELSFICNIESDIYSELAQCYERRGRKDLAESCLRHGEDSMHRLNKLVSWQDQVDNEYGYIDSYVEHGDYNRAENAYERILNIINKNIGKLNNDYVSYACLYGSLYITQYDKSNDPELLHKALPLYAEILRIIYTNNVEFEYIDLVYTNYFRCLVLLNLENEISEVLNMAADHYADGKRESERNTMYLRLGEAYYGIGNYAKAVTYLSKSLKDNDLENADATDISILLDAMYCTKDARCLNFTDSTMPIMKKKANTTKINYRSYFQDAMYVYIDNNDTIKAIDAGTIALAYCRQENKPRYLLNILENLAAMHSSSNIKLSEQYLQEGHSLLPEVETFDQLNFAHSESCIYMSLQRYDDAIRTIERALSDIHFVEKDEPFYATLYHNLGRAYMLLNNYDKAVENLEKSATLQQKHYGTVIAKTDKYLQECYTKK